MNLAILEPPRIGMFPEFGWTMAPTLEESLRGAGPETTSKMITNTPSSCLTLAGIDDAIVIAEVRDRSVRSHDGLLQHAESRFQAVDERSGNGPRTLRADRPVSNAQAPKHSCWK
ncbi:MAG: hypothetical protein FJ404_17400 [Verrucomicrobia bacterium]|nr:hypothetical protein [Verrucomicrobiota bacterium]